jgi:GNAT superfamily N-acetyltransferase
MPEVTIRAATAADAATIVRLIRALAEYEKLSGEVRISEADVLRDGFGERPCFECLLAEQADQAVGLALFYPTYSTFAGRPELWVEDFFVVEAVRGQGVGRRLMARLAALALERGWPHLALSVLHWNPARDFYRRLGFAHTQDWLPYRLDGDGLRGLAAEDGGSVPHAPRCRPL